MVKNRILPSFEHQLSLGVKYWKNSQTAYGYFNVQKTGISDGRILVYIQLYFRDSKLREKDRRKHPYLQFYQAVLEKKRMSEISSSQNKAECERVEFNELESIYQLN